MYKLFKQTDFNIKKTIIFAILVGIFCGIFAGMPYLKDSSFTDMAGGYEFWVVSALIICCNSKSFKLAGIYTGLFFLISQPLQFFIQAFLYSHNYINAYNYFILWLPIILLTIPGGMIAYLVKKDNVISGIVLAIGNSIQGVMFIHYLTELLNKFPRHLISTIFSFCSIFIMSFVYLSKKNRLISLLLPILITFIIVMYAKCNGLVI